ncbi:MAG: DVU_1556 family methyltransferase [Oscillospiraceae bacterium]
MAQAPNDAMLRATCRPGGLALTEVLVAKSGLRPPAACLDVACGSGATVHHLREACGFEAFGVDVAPSAEEAGIVAGPAEALPFEAGRFDAVFCECSLSLFEAPARALGECARVLRPGGALLLSDLYSRTAALRLKGQAKNLYTKAELERLLAGQGFAITWFEDHSDALKEMVAWQILQGGSDAFYRALGTSVEAMKQAKCGYYLLGAKRAAHLPPGEKNAAAPSL